MKELSSLIVGKLKPKESPQEIPEAAEPMEQELDGLDMAVEELMAALEAKDVQGAKEALKNAIYLCKDEE